MSNTLTFEVGYNKDSLTLNEAITWNNILQEGYTYAIEEMEYTKENCTKLIEDLHNIYNIKEYDFSDSKNMVHKHMKSDEMYLIMTEISGYYYVNVMCKSLEITELVYSYMRKYLQDEENNTKIIMTNFSNNGGRVTSSTRKIDSKTLNYITPLYYPYIDTDIMFEHFLNYKENILIVTGEPGLGKSKMATLMLKYSSENPNMIPYDKTINSLINVPFVSAAYVKSTEVLADDFFWNELQDKNFDFVVLDDLDFFLTKREAEMASSDDKLRNQFLNHLLSYTDGIEHNKTKFIITTNQKFEDLDTALLRKGRLFDILELRKLTKQEALDIWLAENLNEGEFNIKYQNDDILPADLGSDIAKILNNKVKKKEIKYLKEPGISKIEKAKKSKKVGF